MTYKELYQEVLHLGIDADIESDEDFLFAAGRAHLQLFSELRVRGEMRVTVERTGTHSLPLPKDALSSMGCAHIDGTPVTCTFLAGEVRLEAPCTGTLYLPYARAPKPITGEDGDEVIDVPLEGAHLLALLVASYLYLRDDAERAQYYFTLYRDAIARVLGARGSYTCTDAYADVLGW